MDSGAIRFQHANKPVFFYVNSPVICDKKRSSSHSALQFQEALITFFNPQNSYGYFYSGKNYTGNVFGQVLRLILITITV